MTPAALTVPMRPRRHELQCRLRQGRVAGEEGNDAGGASCAGRTETPRAALPLEPRRSGRNAWALKAAGKKV